MVGRAQASPWAPSHLPPFLHTHCFERGAEPGEGNLQSSWLHGLEHFYSYFHQTLQCGYNIVPLAENFPPTQLLWFRNGTPQFRVSTETLQAVCWSLSSPPPFVEGWGELEAQMVKITGWGKNNLMKTAMS